MRLNLDHEATDPQVGSHAKWHILQTIFYCRFVCQNWHRKIFLILRVLFLHTHKILFQFCFDAKIRSLTFKTMAEYLFYSGGSFQQHSQFIK